MSGDVGSQYVGKRRDQQSAEDAQRWIDEGGAERFVDQATANDPQPPSAEPSAGRWPCLTAKCTGVRTDPHSGFCDKCQEARAPSADASPRWEDYCDRCQWTADMCKCSDGFKQRVKAEPSAVPLLHWVRDEWAQWVRIPRDSGVGVGWKPRYADAGLMGRLRKLEQIAYWNENLRNRWTW